MRTAVNRRFGTKPPAVADRYAHWTIPPAAPSPRLRYWVRAFDAGWRPNRRIGGLGYDSTADELGVYIWEWLHVLYPLLNGEADRSEPRDARVGGEFVRLCRAGEATA